MERGRMRKGACREGDRGQRVRGVGREGDETGQAEDWNCWGGRQGRQGRAKKHEEKGMTKGTE